MRGGGGGTTSLIMLVTLYGRLGDLAAPQVEVDVPAAGCTVAELRLIIGARHPALAEALGGTGVRACIADVIAGEDGRVSPDDRVEFLPRVSGG